MASSVNFGQQQYFGFDPRTLPGCVLWMDGADATTMSLTGSSVTQWRDKSASGATFTTVNANPTYTPSLINGVPGLDLTNASGFISSTTQTLTNSLTLAMVLVVKSGIGAWGSFFTHGSRDLDIALERNSVSAGTTLQFQTANDNTGANLTFTTDQVALYLGTMTTGTSRFFSRFGGGTTNTATGTNTSTITVGLQTIRIGRSDTGENCNSLIGEVIYYNRVLTDSERVQVEGYLTDKWRLQSSLPASHPYRTIAPEMRLFQPVDVPGGALLWLDAADTTTVTGSPITLWTDKSGRGSNATTGLGSVVAGTAINSQNTVRLGLNTTLNLSNFIMPTSQTSVFYVIRGITSNANTSQGTGYFIFSRTTDNFLVYTGNQQFFSFQNTPAARSYNAVMGPGGERNWGNLPVPAFFNATSVVSITGVSYSSSNGLSLPQVGANNVSNTVFTASTYQLSSSRNIGDVNTYDLGELVVCDGTVSIPAAQQVEGYLAWKWGVRNSLPAAHPYRNVLPSTALFVPTSISNCALWFDAADTTTITGTTQVTVWTNKGTLGGNATPRTGSCTSGNIANGLNFVRCPAGMDLQFTAALNTQARSWFFVARKTPPLIAGPTYSAIVGQPGVSGQDGVVIAYIDATTNNIGHGPAAVRVSVSANVPAATTSSVFMSAIVNGTVAQNRLTLNGEVRTLLNSVAASSYRTASSTYILGGRADYNQSIDIMEVIFYYGAVTDAQRRTVEGYLAWKWGLTALLPSSHTHAKFRP